MEINIHNAFRTAVFVSWGPCKNNYELLCTNLEELAWGVVGNLLTTPFHATLISLISIMMVLIIVMWSLGVLLGVAFVMVAIMLFEGFVVIVFTAVFIVVSAISTSVAISVLGIAVMFLKQSNF